MLALITAFIYFKGLRTYPFEEDNRVSSLSDRQFFDPEKDNFYDVETNAAPLPYSMNLSFGLGDREPDRRFL